MIKKKGNTLKDRIKAIAKVQGIKVKDIEAFWQLSAPGTTKRINSKDFPYSKAIHDLAGYLKCSVDDILGNPKPDKKQPKVSFYELNDPLTPYKTGNPDSKKLIETLKAENEILRKEVKKNEDEIAFLRELLLLKSKT